MAQERLYVLTDINVPITLGGDIAIGDISDMTVRFVKFDGSATVEFKKSDGKIDIIADQITLRIPKTSITADGVYYVYVFVTDNDGKVLGLTPTPLHITFYKNY
ncbi:MAG: hypothetical protein KBC53_04040 [Nitrosomonas sp.]|nr:hypothetical protein [Nitrosomonas sp.]